MSKFASDKDTIVAIATPEGTSALGVIRIDGSESFNILSKLANKPDLASASHKSVSLTKVFDSESNILDQLVVTAWRNPGSYTGNDLVELSCHGGHKVLANVLNRVLELGARAARAGEFTQRAFLNGKMSLDKTEVVSSLIHAKTEATAKVAARMLSFGVEDRLLSTRNELLEILSRVEIGLDFIEEDLDEEVAAVSVERLLELSEDLRKLAAHYQASRYLNEGANIVIAGAPNVGKSTLLNYLAGYDRAIVSEIPGTTRDYLEIQSDWNGIPVTLFDTAGLRQSQDIIEEEGTKRSVELLKTADKIFWLLAPPDFILPDQDLLTENNLIIVINKSDLEEEIPDILKNISDVRKFTVSAKTGKNIDSLIKHVTDDFLSGYSLDNLMLLGKHQADLLGRSADCICNSINSETETPELEFLAADLHEALYLLGQITGEFSSEDLLNRIFSNFCIGK